eukprot:CAMPEP_0172792846 /NCGR_PEP_ID=MMETSP1074-20121228/209181_1 /TAXON_ID=2916 /ORGANISM="Ceratium fusus, Strain PA161109" /LENGTH=99 /DNA_ID=CAMNT_0013629917 /DNA_START=1144 /DNA_END=1443 /DNA_ORIENTATION=-
MPSSFAFRLYCLTPMSLEPMPSWNVKFNSTHQNRAAYDGVDKSMNPHVPAAMSGQQPLSSLAATAALPVPNSRSRWSDEVPASNISLTSQAPPPGLASH